MFPGYPEGVKGFRLWCIEKGQPKVLISRDVVFREFEMYYSKEDSNHQHERLVDDERIQLEVEPFEEPTVQDNSEGSETETDHDQLSSTRLFASQRQN